MNGFARAAAVCGALVALALSGCAADPPPGTYDAPPAGQAAPTSGAVEPAGQPGASAGSGAAPASDAPAAGAGASTPTAGAEAPAAGLPSDDVFGQSVPRAEAYWVEDGRIHRGGEEVRLIGVNWFGLDTATLALFGPVEARRGVHEFVGQVRDLGFNAIRVPLSPESIHPGNPTAGWAVRGDIDTGYEQLQELLAAAENAEVRLLLDFHTCAAAAGHEVGAPDDAACGGYSVDDWIGDLEVMAALAQAHAPWVVGIDLFNEPHALDWSRWRSLVERGGEAVLRANPSILVFVEGIGARDYAGRDAPFWGENLTLAQSQEIALPESRLVYSPHVYGPSVAPQAYFQEGSFPANMPGIWDEHFGFLFDAGAPLVVGEFGGRYEGSDRQWQDAFVDYLLEHDPAGFFYWSLNPNSSDTGGLLLDDWRSVDEGKLALLRRLMP